MVAKTEKASLEEKPRIYHARVALNLTQEEFAPRVGIHPVTLSKLENWGITPAKGVARKVGAITGQSAGEVIHDYETRRAS